jgi:hypothetical protein
MLRLLAKDTLFASRRDACIVDLGLRTAWQAVAQRSIPAVCNFLSIARGQGHMNQVRTISSARHWNDERELQMTQVPARAYANSFVFRYPQLTSNSRGSGKQMIRLLELLPGQGSELIVCNLRQASLLDSPKYEVISYCWSDPSDWTSILCNNKWLSIPKTLLGALHGLRYSDAPRILWADAICINQSDTSERNRQVQFMRTIYSQSQGTLIWLGEPGRDGEGAISFMARVAISIGLEVLKPRGDCLTSSLVYFRNSQNLKCTVRSPFSSGFYIELIGMLRNPWFQRAWVVQEVAVSSKATVVWGFEQCEWTELIQALKFMSGVNFPLAFMPTLQHICAIEHERERFKQGGSTLLGLLRRHRRCLSTNPRDKVYAFCGLMDTSPSERIDVHINYEDDILSVYWEAATSILRHDRTLDILSHPPLPGGLNRSALPSWVPDWSKSTSLDMAHRWELGPLSLAEREFIGSHRRRFAATSDSEYSPEFSSSGEVLIVNGYIFDTVTQAGPVFRGVQMPRSVTTLWGIARSLLVMLKSFLRTRSVIIQWEDMARARSKAKYITDEDILDVFWQTVSAGEASDSPTVRFETQVWDTVNRFSPFPRKLHLDVLNLPYWVMWLFWNAVMHKPVLRFEMQGRYTLNRRLVKTEKGYIGIASCPTEIGDSVALCKGSKVPLIIRARKESTAWRLVGDAYVHGIMNGTAFEEHKCRKMSFS